MTFELSAEELEIIRNWYHAAAGESSSGLSISPIEQLKDEYKHEHPARIEEARKVKAVVEKLGFEFDERDAYAMKRVGLL